MAMKLEVIAVETPERDPVGGGRVVNSGFSGDDPIGEVSANAGYRFVRWEFWLTIAGQGETRAAGSIALQNQLAAQIANPSFHISATRVDMYADSLILHSRAYFAPDSSPSQQVSGIVAMAVDENGMFGGGKVQIDSGAKDVIVSAVVNAGTPYVLNAEADQGYMFTKWVSQYGKTYYTSTVTAVAVSRQPSCSWWAYFMEKASGSGKILRSATSGKILRSADGGLILRKGTAQASQS